MWAAVCCPAPEGRLWEGVWLAGSTQAVLPETISADACTLAEVEHKTGQEGQQKALLVTSAPEHAAVPLTASGPTVQYSRARDPGLEEPMPALHVLRRG